jgi:hypothetical protein
MEIEKFSFPPNEVCLPNIAKVDNSWRNWNFSSTKSWDSVFYHGEKQTSEVQTEIIYTDQS